jgi:Ni/Co efflux regulator RcnB
VRTHQLRSATARTRRPSVELAAEQADQRTPHRHGETIRSWCAAQPPADQRRRAIILELEPHTYAVAAWRRDEYAVAAWRRDEYAVAAWRRDEDVEPLYEIVNEDIREVKVAATLARATEGKSPGAC